MKKSFITMFVICAGILSFSSCQKELVNVADSSQPAKISRTVTVSPEPWTGEETKTAFVPGTGVQITGTEKMSVFYGPYTEAEKVTGLVSIGELKAGVEPKDGKWSFSHDAIEGAEAYNYLFVLPYANQTTAINNAKTAIYLELPFIQFPSEDSFDSGCDFLLGQPQFNVEQKTEVPDIKFKRLFAPLKVEILDSKNVLGDEKIRAVSFKTNMEAGDDALVGRVCYAFWGSEYADTKVGPWSGDSSFPGNSLTAFYGTGHTARNAWFIVNPRTVPKDTKITLIVTTDSKTITRTATLLQDETINRYDLNVVQFDISGDGYAAENTEFFDFNAISEVDDITSITGSNGTTSPWTHSNGTTIAEPMCFRLRYNSSKNASLSLDASTKKVTKIRFYSHPRQPYAKGDIKLNDTEKTVISTIYSVPAANGGYIDIDIPKDLQSKTIKLTAKTNISVFTGATLFYGE